LALALAVVPPARAQAPERPSMTVAATINAQPSAQVPFPIRLGKGPSGSFVRVRKLPLSAALSEGYAIARDAWVVPLSALSNLKITLPATVSGKAQMVVELVGLDGTVLVEARSILVIGAPSESRDTSENKGQDKSQDKGPDARERAQRFVQKGNEALAQGQVAPARLLFERAADLGLGEAAMALAETYDPAVLGVRPHLRGVQPDLDQARRWYERARTLGVGGAAERLRRLGR
jgi:TPR repeat protein